MKAGVMAGWVLGAILCVGCAETEDAAVVTFEDVRAEEVTGSRAVIRFSTSVPTTCEVRFGTSEGALERVATDPNMAPDEPYAIDHEVPLEDLSPETRYLYRAVGETESGVSFESELFEFSTGSADAAAPGENVALISAGAEVLSVSSNFGGADNDQAWGAEQALDGEMGTAWSTNGDGDGAHLEIGLGAEVALTGWGFRSREMADGSAIITSARLIVDGDAVLGPFETPDPSELYVFSFDAPVSAERVRLEVVTSTGGNTGAREVQLYAASAE